MSFQYAHQTKNNQVYAKIHEHMNLLVCTPLT